jgi:hypothetical protein
MYPSVLSVSVQRDRTHNCAWYTAKTQYRKFKTNIPRFPGEELRGYSPNPYIHVSVSDLYIPLVGLHNLLQENRWTKRGVYRSLTHMNVEIGLRPRRVIPFLGTHKFKYICSVVIYFRQSLQEENQMRTRRTNSQNHRRRTRSPRRGGRTPRRGRTRRPRRWK